MNRKNILQKFLILVALLFSSALYGDEGTVTFTNKSSYTSSMTPQAIKKIGNNTYGANGVNGVVIFSDDGGMLSLVKSQSISGDTIKDIAVEGENIYAVSTTKLYVLDSNLTIKGTILLSGEVNSVEVKSNIVFIANGTNGIVLVDATTKTAPSNVGKLSTTDAKKMIIKNNTLYLADGWGGLKVIDITTPTFPRVVTTDDTETYTDIAFDTTKLFALSGSKIRPFDITNEILPIKKTLFDTTKVITSITSIFSYDSNVYIGTTSGISSYSTVDMNNLVSSGTYSISNVNDLFIVGGYGYIATSNSINLALFDSDFADDLTKAHIATSIGGLPQKIEGTLPDDENDVDYIKLILPNFGIFSLSVDTKIGNLKVTLFDENNETIAETNNTTSAITDFQKSLTDGTYFLKIESTTNSSGIYNLSMSVASDDFTDSKDGALSVFDKDTIAGNISTTADKDIFKIFIADAGKLTLNSSEAWLKASILKNNKDGVINGTGSIEEEGIFFDIPYGGTYFIEISGDITGDYSFTNNFSTEGTNPYEDVDKPQLTKLQEQIFTGNKVITNSDFVFVSDSGKVIYTKDQKTLGSVDTLPNTKANIKDMVIAGEYLYYSLEGTFGIGIAKVGSNGALTVQKESFSVDNGVSISKLVLDGNFLYAFSGTKLYKINIATKTAPVLDSANIYNIGTEIYDIDIKYSAWNRVGAPTKTRNGYIYIATQNGLKVFGIDDKALLTIYEGIDTNSTAKLKIYNNRMYTMNNSTKSLNIYDISVPVYASKLGSVRVDENTSSIEVTKNRLFLAPKMQVIDISDEKNPNPINSLPSLTGQKDIALFGGVAYSIGSNLTSYEIQNDYNNSALSVGTTIKGNISKIVKEYGTGSDTDKFIITATNSGTITLDFNGTVGLDFNTTLTSKTSSDISVGTYEVEVFSTNGTDGNYTLNTTFAKDDFPDEIANATYLDFDSNGIVVKSGNLSSTGDDKDYFKIDLTRRGTLTLKLTGNVNAKVELIDKNKKTIYSKEYNTINGTTEYKVETTLNPDTYYLLVTKEDNNTTKVEGNYSLEVIFTPNDDFVLNEKIPYDQLIYGNSFIYTMLGNKLNVYSHLLQKVSQKELTYDTTKMCSKPIVVGNYMYYNQKSTDTQTINPCDQTKYTLSNGGYVKYNLNVGEDDRNEISSEYYRVYQEAFMTMEYEKDPYMGITALANIDTNSLVMIDSSKIATYTIPTDKTQQMTPLDSEKLIASNKVIVDGNYLYSLDRDGNKLNIYDISDKAHPILKKDFDTYTYSRDMILKGNYLYLASNSGIIHVLDISNKSAPTKVFSGLKQDQWNYYYDTVYNMVLNSDDNKTLYLQHNTGFYIVDISDPTAPVYKLKYYSQSYSSDGINRSLKYLNKKVYNLYAYSLDVVDVNNSTNPALYAFKSNGISASDIVVVSEDTIYIKNSSNIVKTSLAKIKSNDSNVSNISSIYDTIKYQNGVIYQASSSKIDEYDENLTFIKNDINITQSPADFTLNDGYIYVANSDLGYSIYRDGNSTRLNVVGYNTTTNNFQDMVLKNNIAYVANSNSEAGIKIYDISDKANIVYKSLVKVTDNSNYGQSISKVAIDGNNIYPYNTYFLAKYSISNPTNPTKVLGVSNLKSSSSLYYSDISIGKMIIDGNYGYIANQYYNNYGLTIINLTDFSIVKNFKISTIGTPKDLVKKGNTVYIGGSSGFAAVDVSSLSTPSLKKTIDKYQYVNTLALDGDFLYVGTSGNLIKYDISDPQVPVIKEIAAKENSNYPSDTSSFSVDKMHIYNGKIYGNVTKEDKLKIIDLNSSHQLPYYTYLSKLNILYGDDKYLYEYGTLTSDSFGNSVNKSILSRILNTNDTNNYELTESKGQYEVSGITIVRSNGEDLYIALGKTLQVVSFDSFNKATVKSEITFDNNITHMEVLGTKKTLYIHIEGTKYIKVYDIKDNSNLAKIQEYDTNEILNSIFFRSNKVYISSPNYGVKIAYTDEKGILVPDKDFENIGVSVDNVYSVDNSTFNYTATDGNISKLNVFILKEKLSDGISDSSYSQGSETKPPKEGCFIATAAFGSYFEKHVKVLRDFRDRYLKTNPIGLAFVDFYYTYSPAIADMIADNEIAKVVIRSILTPIVYLIEYPLYGFLLIGLLFGVRREYRKSRAEGTVAQ